jgi:FtsP/CotA-like multicopper oxidase with cupredoxin domain
MPAFTRRSALQFGGLSVLGAAAVGVPVGNAVRAKAAGTLAKGDMPARFTRPLPIPRPMGARGTVTRGGRTMPLYEVVERATSARISPKWDTTLLGYNGSVPGPLVVAERGQPLALRVRNKLPALHPVYGHELRTSTHLHGSASLPQYDGYANDMTPVGYYKDYEYPNAQNARTLWYHDHQLHYTAQNVNSGLAAMYVLHDDMERALLPQGKYDVPLVVGDLILDSRGQLMHNDNSHSGLWGDIVTVNGAPWPYLEVEPRVYRFRILAGSVGRSWRWSLSNGLPFHVVATDGGLMPKTQTVQSFRHGMAERYEVLVDFRQIPVGTRIDLNNLSNDNNIDYDFTNKVMQFRVVPAARDSPPASAYTIPTTLFDTNEVMTLKASDAVKRRYFRLHRKNGLWAINDETWDEVTASNFRHVQADPGLGDVEIWTIENKGGGWFHPTHIHLVDFQILSRNGRPPLPHERGPKDVVYVGENESVDLLMKFGPHRGRYMVHCHNVSHEDHDMMTQFSVGLPKDWTWDDNDPVAADPCKYDDLV